MYRRNFTAPECFPPCPASRRTVCRSAHVGDWPGAGTSPGSAGKHCRGGAPESPTHFHRPGRETEREREGPAVLMFQGRILFNHAFLERAGPCGLPCILCRLCDSRPSGLSSAP